MFAWKIFKHYYLDFNKLPAKTEFYNQPEPFFVAYKYYIIVVSIALFILDYVCLILPLVAVIVCMRYSNYPVVLISMFIAWGILYAPFLNGRRFYMKKPLKGRD